MTTILYMDNIVVTMNNSGPRNIVLITSVLYTVNGTHPMSRSVFSHEERFEQTKKTIQSARKYIPNSMIFFVECSPLQPQHREYIQSSVDYFFNLWDTELRDRMFTNSKALGEGTQTLYVLDFLKKRQIPFQHFFKISGRYFLDERFDYKKWDNENIVIQDWNESKSVFTFLYKMSKKHVDDWQQHLIECQDNMRKNMGYEVIYGLFVEKHAYEVEFIDVMGIEGYISPSGSHVYI